MFAQASPRATNPIEISWFEKILDVDMSQRVLSHASLAGLFTVAAYALGSSDPFLAGATTRVWLSTARKTHSIFLKLISAQNCISLSPPFVRGASFAATIGTISIAGSTLMERGDLPLVFLSGCLFNVLARNV